MKVGLAGGIATGKSTVCKIFEILNVPIYYSDLRAKWLIRNSEDLKALIIKNFGKQSFDQNGDYNTKYIAKIVFNDKSKLALLNHLVHPEVRADYELWQLNQIFPYTIHESALMYSTGFYKLFDQIVAVESDQSLRLQRIMSRDEIDFSSAMKKIEMQTIENKIYELADFIIHNNNEPLIPQIWMIHHTLLKLSSD